MKTFVLLLAVLGLSACGSSGGGGGAAIPGSDLPELTGGQKNRVKTVSYDMNDINGATQSYNENTPTSTNSVATELVAKALARLSEKSQKLKNKMDTAINYGECSIITKPNSIDNINDGVVGSSNFEILNPSNMEMEFLISNGKSSSSCPIYYRSYIKVVATGEGANTSAKTISQMEFRVEPSTSIYEDVDVTGYKFDLNSEMTVAMQGQTAAQFGVNVVGSGHVESKSEGNVEIGLGLNGSGLISGDPNTKQASGTVGLGFTFSANFSDFQVVGFQQITVTLGGAEAITVDIQYYVNGQSVEADEFNNIFSEGLAVSDKIQNLMAKN